MTEGTGKVETYPPGKWSPRPEPTAADIDVALRKSRNWWWYAAFGNADDCLQSFLDLFDRFLAGEVNDRAIAGIGQYSLEAHTSGESVSRRGGGLS